MSRSLERSLDKGLRSYEDRSYRSRAYAGRNYENRNYRRKRYSKRRQQVQRQLLLLGCLLILMISVLVNCYLKRSQTTAEVQKMVNTEGKEGIHKIQPITIEEETEEEKVARIRRNAQENGYPESVIELLDKNPETVDFVAHYGEKANAPSAETIGDVPAEGLPQLYQWDERWGYAVYGTSIVAVSGCGPTCMAMVASGLLNDPSITPAKVAAYAMENGYIDENNDTYWRFMKEASANWNLSCYDGQLTEEQVRDELAQGHPIICTVGPGDFTQNGHFIVLTQYADGKVRVNDPFSRKNTDTEWEFAHIAGQINAMWVYSVE